jgi:hypothetical protein
MSNFDPFLTHVRPHAPGVPDTTAFKNIRLAAIEFCERTRLWKYEDDYDVTAETCDDLIYTPSGSTIHDIEIITFNGAELLPRSTRDLDRLAPGWRSGEATGVPRYYSQIDQNSLRLVPAMEGHVYLCMRLKPSQDAKTLPDFLANEYRECIGWGALARLLIVPGQSYTNPDLASYFLARFTAKLDSLSTKGTTGQQNAPKRTRASFF